MELIMSHFTLNKIIAAGALALSLTAGTAAVAMVQDTTLPQFTSVLPGMPGNDDQAISRRGRGADDAAGHTRRGRGKDDGAGHTFLNVPAASEQFARRGRGADDPAGHVRGGKGKDDPAGHAALQLPVDPSLEFARRGRGKDDAVNHG
ncbi:MAG: hypothetical protein CFE33_08255 [Pseudorhodobacter sp. PARRP1]|nr:MAG: hypothetical protein CFE33_08255 [Pseudorhodobacter sp. PARRP1]